MDQTREKKKVPAIEGWFTMDFQVPHLIGTQCQSCQSLFFPKETKFCRNPNCAGTELKEVHLSHRGKLWSFTLNYYKAPPPFVAAEPFVPYGSAVVELEKEKMMVLGQVAQGVDCSGLKIGMEMELVLEKLYEDENKEYLVWKWKPVGSPT